MTAPQDPYAAPPPQGGGSYPPPQGGQGSGSQGSQGGYGYPPPSGSADGFGGSSHGAPTQYGGHDPYGRPAQRRNGFGVAALVLGILAVLGSITIIGGVLLGIAAIVFGVLGRGRAKRGEADNGGMALAGLVLGVVGVLIAGALVAIGVSFLNSDSGKSLQSCLNSAGSDQAAVKKCQDDLSNSLNK